MVQDSNNLRIDISDEGVGFDDSQLKRMMLKSHRYGLFSIRERIRHLGGVLEVKSEIGRGTRVTMLVGLGSELNDIHKG
jgi:signal transduction histidine kinase